MKAKPDLQRADSRGRTDDLRFTNATSPPRDPASHCAGDASSEPNSPQRSQQRHNGTQRSLPLKPQFPDGEVVYFLRRRDGLIKIGLASDLKTRVSGIKVGAGHVDVLGWFHGGRADEEDLHAIFAAERVEGEWFRSSEDLLALLRHLQPLMPKWLKQKAHALSRKRYMTSPGREEMARRLAKLGRKRDVETRLIRERRREKLAAAAERAWEAREQYPYKLWLEGKSEGAACTRGEWAVGCLAAKAIHRRSPLELEDLESGAKHEPRFEPLLQILIPAHEARDRGMR